MSDTELIRCLTGSRREDEAKRRAFVQTALGFAAVMIVYGVAIGVWLPGDQLGIWIPPLVAAGSLILAFWAHRARTIAGPAYIAVGIGIMAVLAGASISGGVDDYTAPFFIVIPVVAGFFLGARGAVICGLATIAGATALAIGDLLGFVVETPYSEVYFEGASGIVLVACIAMTMFTARQFSKRVDEHAANLTQSNELLSAFARTAPIAVAMFDRDIRYIEASDRWLSDYGLSRENLIGRSHYEVFPEIRQVWKEVHQRCLAGATERSESDKFTRADGTEQWILWEVRPWREAKGEIGGIIMISRDITEQIRAQEALKTA
ncbi:MAG: PAS domain S-box protein, partial [Amphiplicatus sp.]